MPARPGYCPACERFIGPLDACPYCDCPCERQAGLRLLRALALAVAVGGLVLLGLAVRRHEAPRVAVSAIAPSMNFARVRVEGAVSAVPKTGQTRSGEPWFGFTLADGSGRIRVSAFGDVAAALAAGDTLAGLTSGAPVRAEGWLNIRAGQMPTLQLRDPAHLQLGGAP